VRLQELEVAHGKELVLVHKFRELGLVGTWLQELGQGTASLGPRLRLEPPEDEVEGDSVDSSHLLLLEYGVLADSPEGGAVIAALGLI